MRVIGIVLMGLLVLACGSEPETPAVANETASTSKPAANQAPVVRDVHLQPEAPTVGDKTRRQVVEEVAARSVAAAEQREIKIECTGTHPGPIFVEGDPGQLASAVANQAPVVRDVHLQPEAPTVGDTVTLSIKTMDPDNDRLDLRVEWFRNGHLVQNGPRATLATAGFRRGDQAGPDPQSEISADEVA